MGDDDGEPFPPPARRARPVRRTTLLGRRHAERGGRLSRMLDDVLDGLRDLLRLHA